MRRRTAADPAAPPERSDGLPEPLRTGLEALGAVALDGVRVHRDSPRPARLGALAYTEGSDIYLGPGQATQLPHEAWHVVQQRQGRVGRTGRVGGQALNDDAGLEAEANDMGERAGGHPGGRPAPAPAALAASRSGTAVVQRVIAGLGWVQADGDVPDGWVDAYLNDLTHPHTHLYEADIVEYLTSQGLPDLLQIAQFGNPDGKHWDLKLLNHNPNGGPVVVRTMADGSCGAYLIHAIVHRDAITADVVNYTAPDDYVRKVRRAIQGALGAHRAEIQGRIRGEIVRQTNVFETGFGPGLQRVLTDAARRPAPKRGGPVGKKSAKATIESPRPTTEPDTRPRKVLDAGAERAPTSGGRPRPAGEPTLTSSPALSSSTSAPTSSGTAKRVTPVIDNAAGLRKLADARTSTAAANDPDMMGLITALDDLETDVGTANTRLAALEQVRLDKGPTSPATKQALTAALTAVQSLDQDVYARIEYWSSWVATHPWVASVLGYLKELSRLIIQAAQLVNQRFDQFHGRTRIGAGGAPELVKEPALVKAARHEAANGKHALSLRKAIEESILTKGKETAEPLSMARAVQGGVFKDMRFLPKSEAPDDIDFTSTSRVQGYNNWDQKSMYVDAASWSGRIPHTHAKTHRGQRTGILLDTTYATEKDYARAWMELNRMTVQPTALEDKSEILVDPRAYFEVRAADPTIYEREIAFDARGGTADPTANNLALFRSKIGPEAFAAQRFKDVFGLKEQIDKLIADSVIRGYADHRNALPPGNYMEFDQGIDLGMQAIHYATVRVVREHETGRLYLSLTHYKPFTWYDEKGGPHQGRPFFEVVTDGSAASAGGKESGPAPSDTEDKAIRPAVRSGNPAKAKGQQPATTNNKSKK